MPGIRSTDDSHKDDSSGENANQDTGNSSAPTSRTQIGPDDGILDDALENNDLDTEHSTYLELDGKNVSPVGLGGKSP